MVPVGLRRGSEAGAGEFFNRLAPSRYLVNREEPSLTKREFSHCYRGFVKLHSEHTLLRKMFRGAE